ncbi:hypothetical protein E3V91_05565 [Streptococcus pseudopneumoniae]|jgi:hypothetical protein|uniref:hypothetical protein n=1 Tax=Streptococcus pseudopneumoniae TaxID=257758 RepID=UPI00110AA3A5|nr:hypothetical protein [Streptococcus pseudopneumoniae]MBF9636511.1 hypothetical protein [Streptococcus pseudopneumoniae]MQQ65292.1 hypothetical protein [Streptococcus mitis]TMR72875.1 hypothetical protein E3V91_05565 [Streptococcus pseudopneumoniae]DAK95960.1 MAG TPA: NikA, BACTERIAL CONJUGATION, RELAXASE, DNA [Caudoviricetes sp.]
MAKKMGRPFKSSEPRIKSMGYRMTQSEFEMLEYCAQKAGKSKSEILSDGIKKVYDELKGK